MKYIWNLLAAFHCFRVLYFFWDALYNENFQLSNANVSIMGFMFTFDYTGRNNGNQEAQPSIKQDVDSSILLMSIALFGPSQNYADKNMCNFCSCYSNGLLDCSGVFGKGYRLQHALQDTSLLTPQHRDPIFETNFRYFQRLRIHSISRPLWKWFVRPWEYSFHVLH